MRIDPRIDNRVATSGASSHKFATPQTTEVITDAARSSGQQRAVMRGFYGLPGVKDGQAGKVLPQKTATFMQGPPRLNMQFLLEVSASPQPEVTVGAWRFSINDNPLFLKKLGIPKS